MEEPEWIITKPIMEDNWNACIQTLEGHRHWVNSVAWSHDASQLASASHDNTVKIWDPATGQCISTLEIGQAAHYVQFNKSISHHLHTNAGTFDLRPSASSAVLTATSSNYLPSSPLSIGYGLNSNRTWITYQGRELLWLPHEYVPSCSAISGRVLAIGCPSGRVLTFTFLRDIRS
jgi:WD40 repeat protein